MTHLSSTLYFLILLTVLIRTYPSHAQHCYDASGNFTSNGAYVKNRDAVLRSLPSKVAAHDGFYAASEGENPNTVYAITYCRGDTSADTCKVCVRTAVENLIVKCPNQKAAFSWGTADPPCFIRYSDNLIYGELQVDPVITVKNPNKITMNQDQFDKIWRTLMRRLAGEAGEGSSKLKFAKGQAHLPDNKTIYSLLQCSPDLLPLNCWSCLSKSIDHYDKCCRVMGFIFVNNGPPMMG
ncbi:hypothetical protein NL676_007400 [Syzygium grande]|nr:hypothetical protein NL676_007400 [Syzygium grande]